jgi:hypothetical protein
MRRYCSCNLHYFQSHTLHLISRNALCILKIGIFGTFDVLYAIHSFLCNMRKKTTLLKYLLNEMCLGIYDISLKL